MWNDMNMRIEFEHCIEHACECAGSIVERPRPYEHAIVKNVYYCCDKMKEYFEYLEFRKKIFGYVSTISHDCRPDEHVVFEHKFCPFCGERIEAVCLREYKLVAVMETKMMEQKFLTTKIAPKLVAVGLREEQIYP